MIGRAIAVLAALAAGICFSSAVWCVNEHNHYVWVLFLVLGVANAFNLARLIGNQQP